MRNRSGTGESDQDDGIDTPRGRPPPRRSGLADLRFKIASPRDGGARVSIVDHAAYAAANADASTGFFEREIIPAEYLP